MNWTGLQEDIEPRARTKQAALLEQLQAAMAQHAQNELERKYAVRYHKVRSGSVQPEGWPQLQKTPAPLFC